MSSQGRQLTLSGSRTAGAWLDCLDRHTQYIVCVFLPGSVLESFHRYSALRALHARLTTLESLKGRSGFIRLRPFPAPKRLLKRAAWVVREREALLQCFLDDCAAAAAHSPRARNVLAAFLGLAAHEMMVIGAPRAGLSCDAAERPRCVRAYEDPACLWCALRDEQAILLRGSWVLERAGYEEEQVLFENKKVKTGKWVARREARPLPHRAQIEANHREAIMPVEVCEAANATLHLCVVLPRSTHLPESFKEACRAQLEAAPVFVLSHCWEHHDLTTTTPTPRRARCARSRRRSPVRGATPTRRAGCRFTVRGA